jgi:hypothetical protein
MMENPTQISIRLADVIPGLLNVFFTTVTDLVSILPTDGEFRLGEISRPDISVETYTVNINLSINVMPMGT